MFHPVVCIDNGSGSIKCTVGEYEILNPTHIFPSVVGRPVFNKEGMGLIPDICVGEQTLKNRRLLDIKYPIKGGVIQNWNDMEYIWDYAFAEKLKINPPDCRIMHTEPLFNPSGNRKRTVQLMFEKYGFHGVRLITQSMATICAQGLCTCCVVSSGETVTEICPFNDGYTLAAERVHLGGRHVTSQLIDLLGIKKSSQIEYLRKIKEESCYVAGDIEEENKLAKETTCLNQEFTLPDGSTVVLGKERYLGPEVLFRPGLFSGDEKKGISRILFDTINKTDDDVRPELFNHIVLCGGNTMFSGFISRLEKDMKGWYDKYVAKGDARKMKMFKLTVEASPNRKNQTWKGMTVVADIHKDRNDYWMGREEYEELGIEQILKKNP